MSKLIRFPQERVDWDSVEMDRGEPCVILILPTVPNIIYRIGLFVDFDKNGNLVRKEPSRG